MTAQSNTDKVVSGHHDVLLETTQSWNGKPYALHP